MRAPNMAAPMKTCYSILRKCSFSWNRCRYYARRSRKELPNVITPEEDVQKLKGRIADPRNNAYLPFIPEDPLQRSLSLAAKKKKESVFSKPENENQQHYNTQENVHKGTKSKLLASSHSVVRKGDRREQNTIDFEKLEETDKRFGRLIMVARSKTERDENKEIVLEGKSLIKDALEVGAKLKVLYFTKLEKVEELPTDLFGDAKLYKVMFRHLKLWSDVENPQGLLGIFELPDHVLRPVSDPIPLTLICDSIREGGTLGTLLRSAAAVGCQQVIALKGCVDIWNGKVLRSAVGSHFRIPILSNIAWSQVPAVLPPADDIKVYLADMKQIVEEKGQSDAASIDTLQAVQKLEEIADYESDIEDEMPNVETDTKSDNDDDFGVGNESVENKSLPEKIEEDLSYKSFKVLSAYKNAPLSSRMYDKIDYSNKHTVLVISEEATGLSLPARKLTYDHFGECIHLPVTGEVNSLNCAVAGSVIMFEVAKQYRNNSDSISEGDE